MSIIPTVDDVMSQTAIGCGFHEWRTVGGAIRLTSAELRPILEDAYDSSMPDWVVLALFEDEPEADSEDTGISVEAGLAAIDAADTLGLYA